MIIINDNDYSNLYDESNDNTKKTWRLNNKNNNSTTNVCDNKNKNNRNHKTINNKHGDNYSNNNY